MRNRQNELTVRLTTDELDMLNEKASRTIMNREQLCRRILCGMRTKEAPPTSFHYLNRDIRRIGNLLHQLISKAALLSPGTIPSMQAVLDEVHELDDLMCEAYWQEEYLKKRRDEDED